MARATERTRWSWLACALCLALSAAGPACDGGAADEPSDSAADVAQGEPEPEAPYVDDQGCSGCSAPPICGAPPDPCACYCSPGESYCSQSPEQPAVLRCDGGCWQPASCGTDGHCVYAGEAGPTCVAEIASCEDVAAVYAARTNDSCVDDDQCVVADGHCDVGLGDCFVAIHYATTSQELLDAIAARFEALDCAAGACDCTEPTPTAACVDRRCRLAP